MLFQSVKQTNYHPFTTPKQKLNVQQKHFPHQAQLQYSAYSLNNSSNNHSAFKLSYYNPAGGATTQTLLDKTTGAIGEQRDRRSASHISQRSKTVFSHNSNNALLPGGGTSNSSLASTNVITMGDEKFKMKQVSMTYVFDALYFHPSSIPTQEQSSQQLNATNESPLPSTLKMMDTILFAEDFKPKKWIFTDLLGRIQFKDINSITINDVIRAFLVNLNENKKNEFSNEDLMEFLARNTNRQKICFAIVENKRYFLNIEDLCDIKNKFKGGSGIDALQLYKIPTREFLPYFYFHQLTFKSKDQLASHMMTRLSHSVKDLNREVQRNCAEFYEEKIPDEEYEYFAEQILDLSKQIVARIQKKDELSLVKQIKIAYLIEQANYEPWFIGTEYCHMLQQCIERRQSGYRGRRRKNSALNQERGGGGPKLGLSHRKKTLPSQLEISGAESGQMLQPMQLGDYTEAELQSDYLPQIQTCPEEVFELSNNEIITETDLLKGLLQVGHQYGKDSSHTLKPLMKRPHTMQMLAEKSRKASKYQQQLAERRSKLKEKGRRIIELFPKYLEKTGSKKHAQFLFGNSSSDRVFKEYQRLRFQKDQTNLGTDLCRDAAAKGVTAESKSFYQPKTAIGGKSVVFDIQMSEVNNMTQMETHPDFLRKHSIEGEREVNQSALATEQPYQDNFYFLDQKSELGGEVLNQTLTQEDISPEAILNKDISIFQAAQQLPTEPNTTFYHQQRDITPSEAETKQSQIGNKYLEQSLLESAQKDKDKLQLGDNDFEKNLIQLMLINKELEGVVVLDKDTAISNYQERMKAQQLDQQPSVMGFGRSTQQTQYSNINTNTEAATDQIFTGRRRKLTEEEARTYYQWKQLFNNQQNQSILLQQQASSRQEAHHPKEDTSENGINLAQLETTSDGQVRSKTQVEFRRKRKHRKNGEETAESVQKTPLSKLVIKGNEAQIQQLENQGRLKAKYQKIRDEQHPVYQHMTQQQVPIQPPQRQVLTSTIRTSNGFHHRDNGASSTLGTKEGDEKCVFSHFCSEQIKIARGIAFHDLCYIHKKNFAQAKAIVLERGKEAVIREYRESVFKTMKNFEGGLKYEDLKGKNGVKGANRMADDIIKELIVNNNGAEMLNNLFKNAEKALGQGGGGGSSNGVGGASSAGQGGGGTSKHGGHKKDMSIDVQNTLRRSVDLTSDNADSNRKYLVKVPITNGNNPAAGGEGSQLSMKRASSSNEDKKGGGGGKKRQGSAEIMPCCSRCFTIITYLLN